MSATQDRVSQFFVGFYSWAVTVFFGAVLLDTVYSNWVSEATAAFSVVSDFLLTIGMVTFIAAAAAIALSWKLSIARNYFTASFVVMLFEFLIPVFFSQSIMVTETPGLVSAIRIIINGAASALAMLGLRQFYRQK
jgi:hypothetical protein